MRRCRTLQPKRPLDSVSFIAPFCIVHEDSFEMGLLQKYSVPISEFRVEYLAGSKEAVFGPGSLLQGITLATVY